MTFAARGVAIAAALMAFAPAPAMGAVEFRSASQATAPSAKSVTVAAPARVVPGDVLVANLSLGGAAFSVTSPGWTQVRRTDPGAALDQYSFVHVATAAEPASYTFTASTFRADLAIGVAAYSGVDDANPVDASADAKGAAATAVPSVTTTAPGDAVVGAVALASSAAVSLDSSMTRRYAAQLPKSSITVGDFQAAAPGATGARPFTTGNQPGEKGVQAIALRAYVPPATAGGSAADGWTLASGAPVTPDLLATLPKLRVGRPRARSGAVPVTVSCPAAAATGCLGTVELSLVGAKRARAAVSAARRRKIAGRRHFRIRAGKTAVIRVPLARRTAGRFARRRGARVRMRVDVTTPVGVAEKTTTVTVRARRSARRFKRPKRVGRR